MELIKDLRPELQEVLQSGVEVQRFQGSDLPQGVVIDNVRDHSLRLAAMAMSLPINSQERDWIRRTVLGHDLPEIYSTLAAGRNSDVTLIEKEQNPDLERQVAQAELAAAHIIFTSDELALYEEFEKAGQMLKTKDHELCPASFAVYAQFLDRIDGNLTLHQALSRWAISADLNLALQHATLAIDHTLGYYRRLSGGLTGLVDTWTARTAQDLLDTHLATIMDWWQESIDQGLPLELPMV